MQLVYSTSKNLEALLVARAVQEGYIKYDDPIAKHWPEYTSAPNKENVLIKDLMGHRGGIAWLDEENQIPMDEMHDLDKIASYLARQPHNYDGETKQAYHASTRGLVANEVLRRVTGKDMGRLLQEWIAEPLGVEAYFGLPEHLEERVAKFADYPFKDRPRAKTDPEANAPAASGPGLAFPPGLAEKQATLMKTFGTFKTPPGVDLFDTRVGRAAQVPSANCVTNARSLAKIFATIANHGTLDGTTILSKETLDLASVSQETMDDAALPLPPVPFSTGGWAQWKGLKAPNRFDLKDDEAEWEGW